MNKIIINYKKKRPRRVYSHELIIMLLYFYEVNRQKQGRLYC